ncbi:MAG: zinc dependent phospholipase C family protein [Methanobrevibacter sp.]|nr:zinc dependent phospholipase C family protein [Methanobrevibacter sp.]
MKNKHKGILVMKFLLIFCWAFIGHHILNKYAFDQLLKPTARNKFSETTARRNMMIQSKDSAKCTGNGEFWCDPDNRRDEKNINPNHMSDTSTSLNLQHDRVVSSLAKAREYWEQSKFNEASYAVGYALHYFQDALCPPHIGGIKDSEHFAYEGVDKFKDDWSKKYNITCTDHGNCSGYTEAVSNVSYIDDLIKSTNYDNKTGKNILTDPTVNNYLKNTRWNNHWKAAKTDAEKRKALLWDLGYVMAIQKRYLKGSYFFT